MLHARQITVGRNDCCIGYLGEEGAREDDLSSVGPTRWVSLSSTWMETCTGKTWRETVFDGRPSKQNSFSDEF